MRSDQRELSLRGFEATDQVRRSLAKRDRVSLDAFGAEELVALTFCAEPLSSDPDE
jgi:hypothetical protein